MDADGYVQLTGRIKELINRGAIAPEAMSLPRLRQWLKAHPDERRALLNENPRYIFFRRLEGSGPVGSQGVPLTPGRSLAVDPDAVPLGTPVWLMTRRPLAPETPLRRLVVAQDTGAAIKGTVRGDLFWGHGKRAEKRAGHMKAPGRFILLVPRGTAAAQRTIRGRGNPRRP